MRRCKEIAFNSASFGASIRKRRKKLGYTLKFISEFTGFSVSFISDLERGKGTAELNKALVIANVLGLDCIMKERGE